MCIPRVVGYLIVVLVVICDHDLLFIFSLRVQKLDLAGDFDVLSGDYRRMLSEIGCFAKV